MRLDHLLSKEHLTPKGVEEPACRGCRWGVLIGGDTGEVGAGSGHRPSTASGLVLSGVGFGCVERWVVRLVVAFEASCWVLREQARVGLFLVPGPVGVTASWLGVCRRGWVGWSLFENCTVDASIFVVKLPRANGGCLGTRSR